MTLDEVKDVIRKIGSSKYYGVIELDNNDELWLIKTPQEDVEMLGEFFINHLSDFKGNNTWGHKSSYFISQSLKEDLPTNEVCSAIISDKWSFRK